MKLAETPLCEMDGCNEVAALVHHIKPVKEYPIEVLAWENVMSLCNPCHEQIHGQERWGGRVKS
jgi:5-methylcytosine-specific restriction enzyme A